ncbi:MAG: UTP--glucose-1-phosphate uridylyltransferase [Planctomycetia bacterium]|nr:UTP--glucose-1-phosphate uridylyltransferase [Planctomycetia bacterium]
MYDELIELLTRHKQQHVLKFWDQLDAAAQAELAQEIKQLDWDDFARLTDTSAAPPEDLAAAARRAVPAPAIRLADAERPFSQAEARARGAAALAAGEIGTVLVAGGQGSRLGFEHAKGMFSIGPISGVSLFQILLEKIVATRDRYGAAVPLYLMTSPATHDETTAFLAENHYFGLSAGDVRIFCQGTLPAVDAATGRLLLAAPGHLALSPDGHGGLLAALKHSGSLADMQKRGIKHLFYFQVDNPLVPICDPEMIGSHLLAQSEYTMQVIAKRTPTERLGLVARVDGRMRIIEYSDLPDDVAEARAADGSLRFWAGSTAINILGVKFLTRVAASAEGLPLHRANKKVPFVDDAGQLVEPAAPNAIKFERFIFDLLPQAARGLTVEADPAETFAPVKNAPGEATDTAATCQQMMIAQAQRWLAECGAKVAEGIKVEISPRFALDATQLAARVRPGETVTRDTYFC